MKLYENQVIQILDHRCKRMRIIWIDDEYRICSYVELDKTTFMPKEVRTTDVE